MATVQELVSSAESMFDTVSFIRSIQDSDLPNVTYRTYRGIITQGVNLIRRREATMYVMDEGEPGEVAYWINKELDYNAPDASFGEQFFSYLHQQVNSIANLITYEPSSVSVIPDLEQGIVSIWWQVSSTPLVLEKRRLLIFKDAQGNPDNIRLE